jgi:DNA-binding MarR family transcriptional regulator
MKTKDGIVTKILELGKRIKCRVGQDSPVPFMQGEALRFIAHEQGASMRTIAKHFSITAPSATTLISELVDAGLVKRAGNARDRREVLLTMTAKGSSLLKTLETHREKVISGVFSVLSGEERVVLEQLLEKVITKG